jgi:hypothetical protein
MSKSQQETHKLKSQADVLLEALGQEKKKIHKIFHFSSIKFGLAPFVI